MLGNGNGTKAALEIGHTNGKEKERWPARLAAIWCKTRPEDDRANMERKFEEYRRQGYPGEELEAYLRHSRRNGNELFWKFDSRMPPPPRVPFPTLKARVRELQGLLSSL